MENAEEEIKRGERFAFGKNWQRFLGSLSDDQIASAEASLLSFIGGKEGVALSDRSFLDVGSGSGLSSLVAHRQGAHVHSFDFDESSVTCTRTLKQRYAEERSDWKVEQGSVLDTDYLLGLGAFDWVYSWGVLHHTGQLRVALENVVPLVKNQGHLYIAIYNDQGWISNYWKMVKRIYNGGLVGRLLMIGIHVPYLIVLRWLVRAITGRLNYERGMSLWWDMLDWLGGYPFEVATPGEIEELFGDWGFELVNIKTCGRRQGCNEFLFKRA